MDQKKMFTSVLLDVLKKTQGEGEEQLDKEAITQHLTDALSTVFDLIINYILRRQTEQALALLYSLTSDLILVKLMEQGSESGADPASIIKDSLMDLQALVIEKVEALAEAYKTLEETPTVH